MEAARPTAVPRSRPPRGHSVRMVSAASGSGVVLVEGLPGSGKSTVSLRVSERLSAAGFSCRWVLEESKSHPFFGPTIRAQRRRGDFTDVCLKQWSLVVQESGGAVVVLDGCAFQSTVRYLFEQCVAIEAIRSYWQNAEAILTQTGARFVYLTQPDPRSFMYAQTLPRRGAAWVSKLVSYVESTPKGREARHVGVAGMVEFWMQYRDVCNDLVERSALPVLEIDTSALKWAAVEDEAAGWTLDGIAPISTEPQDSRDGPLLRHLRQR